MQHGIATYNAKKTTAADGQPVSVRTANPLKAAMQVVEKLGEGPWTVMMSSGDERTDKEWFVEFIGTSDDGRFLLTGDADGDSLPEAICHAALAAIGSKE